MTCIKIGWFICGNFMNSRHLSFSWNLLLLILIAILLFRWIWDGIGWCHWWSHILIRGFYVDMVTYWDIALFFKYGRKAILPSGSELFTFVFALDRLAENWLWLWMAPFNSGNLLYYLSLLWVLMCLFLVSMIGRNNFMYVIPTRWLSILTLPAIASVRFGFFLFSLLVSVL